MKICLSILLITVNGLLLGQTDIYPFRKGDNWYYTDKNFHRLSEKNYEEAHPFLYDYAVVKVNGKYGFIDKNENLIIPAMYDYAFVQPTGGLEVKLNNEKFLIDLNNKRLPVVFGCGTSGGGIPNRPYLLNICKEESLYGVDNHSGNNVPPIYDSISIVEYGFAIVVKDSLGKYGIYDTRPKLTYPVKLDSVSVIRSTYALDRILIFKNDKLGAVNMRAQIIAFPKYDNLHFDYEYAPYTILEDGKKGYIIDGIEYWMK